MFGPILKEAVVLIVFCHIFVSGRDLLEIFQPNPALPQELNEWLASVQKHKDDFRLIRESLRKAKKPRIQLEDEDDEEFEKKNLNQLNLEDGAGQQTAVKTDEGPKNDIYPYMYKSDKEDSPNLKNLNAKEGSLRPRRASDFSDHKNFVDLDLKAKVGEVKRSDDKYPERYRASFSEDRDANRAKSNFKEKKEAPDSDKDVGKREVQIDIRKDGKLIKQLREDEANPKSIILNIQPPPDAKKPQTGVVQDALRAAKASLNIDGHVNKLTPRTDDQIVSYTRAATERSANPDQMKSKEFYSNFNNLFSANEHLNTDSSLARQSVGTMGPLVYHVTIPDFVAYPEASSGYKHLYDFRTWSDLSDFYSKLNANNDRGKPAANPYNFNRNDLQDMSKYWTASEKHRMQEGIAFARNTGKLMHRVKFPQRAQAQSDNDTGFEPAQRIEVDNGRLVRINVAERTLEDDGLQGNAEASNHYKRNYEPLSRDIAGEGVVEIDGRDPKPERQSKVANITEIDPRSFTKRDKNGAGANIDILEVDGAKPDYGSIFYKVEESKNTIPNFKELIKLKNKRQLDKIQLIDDDRPEEPMNVDNIGNSLNMSGAPGMPDVPSDVLSSIANDTNFEEDQEFLKQPTDVESFGVYPTELASNLEEHRAELLPSNVENKASNGDISNGNGFIDRNYDKSSGPSFSKEHGNERVKENYEKVDSRHNVLMCDDAQCHAKFRGRHKQAYSSSNAKSPQLRPDVDLHRKAVHERLETVKSARNLNDLEDDARNHQNVAYNGGRRHPIRHHAKIYSERYDPDLKKIVVVYDDFPYASSRRRNARFERRKHADEEDDRSDWDADEEAPNYVNQIVRHLPPNLIIRKRDYFDAVPEAPPRRRFRRRYHDSAYLGKLDFDSNGFKGSNSRDISDLNDNGINFVVGTSSSESAVDSAFVGRRLKAVDYVYDAYDKSGDDYYGDVSTELLEVASESESRAELLQKDSVEGDYGDEEDSVTEKRKKVEFNIVKKTRNEFANPRTTTENEDDNYYNDEYENNSYCGNEKAEGKESAGGETERPPPPTTYRTPAEPNAMEVARVHHGRVGPNKVKPKMHKHTRLSEATKVKAADDLLVQRPPRKFLGQRRVVERRKHAKAAHPDKASEFQRWPMFVVDDSENEEKLRKRSLASKKKRPETRSFPLAARDFFVRRKRKRKAADGKQRAANEAQAPVVLQKRESEKPPSATTMMTTQNPSSSQTEGTASAASAATTCEVSGAAASASGGGGVSSAPGAEETCATRQLAVSNACEVDVNFNGTDVEMTTILPMAQVDKHGANGTKHSGYEKLDDVLDGYFPAKLVADMFEKIQNNSKLKSRFHKGLKKTNKNLAFQNPNDTNVQEARSIYNSMTCLMNKLQLTTSCQVLPEHLGLYLQSITKTKKEDSLARMKEMEDINPEQSQNQKNFIFESIPQGVGNFQDKASVLRDLLDKFNNLPEKCKARAMPVKEYIENHLGMLGNMSGGSGGSGGGGGGGGIEGAEGQQNSPKRDVDSKAAQSDDALIQEQLESLGLGKGHRFTPKFDLDKMIESNKQEKAATPQPQPQQQQQQQQGKSQPPKVNVNKRDLGGVSRSKKYNKLVDAARKVRLRKESERRIAEAFGRSGDYSEFNFNRKSNGGRDVARASFESPLVYSL